MHDCPKGVPPFQLEERYVVVKIKSLSPKQAACLQKVLQDLEISTTDCIVVERNWPCFWDAVALVEKQYRHDQLQILLYGSPQRER